VACYGKTSSEEFSLDSRGGLDNPESYRVLQSRNEISTHD